MKNKQHLKRKTLIEYWYNIWNEMSSSTFPKGTKKEIVEQCNWLKEDAKRVINEEAEFCMEYMNCTLKKTLVYKICDNKDIFEEN